MYDDNGLEGKAKRAKRAEKELWVSVREVLCIIVRLYRMRQWDVRENESMGSKGRVWLFLELVVNNYGVNIMIFVVESSINTTFCHRKIYMYTMERENECIINL